MIDIHSHILPMVDDGAKSVEETIELLERLKEQGITDVIATPHFNPTAENSEQFFDVISKTKKQLDKAIKGKELPRVHLGSEIRYFYGMGKCASLRDFTLASTDYLLVEFLPHKHITSAAINDIIELSENLDLIPVIAHIERYVHMRSLKKILKLVEEEKVLTQMNAQSLLFEPLGKACVKLIKGGYITFLASDCHSIDERPPEFEKAYEIIERECGAKWVDVLKENSRRFLEEIDD